MHISPRTLRCFQLELFDLGLMLLFELRHHGHKLLHLLAALLDLLVLGRDLHATHIDLSPADARHKDLEGS